MNEYKAKLITCRIDKLEIDVDVDDDSALQISASYSASVFEPKDDSDPTTMVKVDCTLSEQTGKKFSVSCSAECYIEFDSIPENRAEFLSEHSRDAIHREVFKKISAILHDMGHDFIFNL